MAQLKTQPTSASVKNFIESITDEKKRQDSEVLLDLMSTATGAEPVMWGGKYHRIWLLQI